MKIKMPYNRYHYLLEYGVGNDLEIAKDLERQFDCICLRIIKSLKNKLFREIILQRAITEDIKCKNMMFKAGIFLDKNHLFINAIELEENQEEIEELKMLCSPFTEIRKR